MPTTDNFTPLRAVFYFRTGDRWPGGNADMLTVKATLALVPGAEVEAQYYHCLDGRHVWAPPRRFALAADDVLAAFLDVIRSLAARGRATLVARPFEPAEDEWDVDWADAEIDLHTTDEPAEPSDPPRLQLVRRTVRAPREVAEEPEVERAFELGRRLIGLGRVFHFANTADALSAALRAPGGPAPQPLAYTVDAAPRYLPPGTDAAFVERQAAAAQREAAEQADSAAQPERMLVFRLDEVPGYFTDELSPDAGPRRCLFYAAPPDSEVVDALFAAVPEPEHDESDAALDIADRVTTILLRADDLPRALRPDAGSAARGGYQYGFHGGDPDAVEQWLDAQGVERVPLRPFLDKFVLLRLVDEDGEPIDQVDLFPGAPPVRSIDSLGDGLYAFERADFTGYKVAAAADDDWAWLTLNASELPPGTVYMRTVPGASTTKQAPAKQTATKKTAAKKTAAKKTAAKKTSTKKTAAKKTSTKKTSTKNTSAKKTAKSAAKKPAAKSSKSR